MYAVAKIVLRIIVACPDASQCTPTTCLAQALEQTTSLSKSAQWCDTDDKEKQPWGGLLRMLQQACDEDTERRKTTVRYASMHAAIKTLRAELGNTAKLPSWLSCDGGAKNEKKRSAGEDDAMIMQPKKVARC